MINFSLRLVNPDRDVRSKIKISIAGELNKLFPTSTVNYKLQKIARSAVLRAVMGQPEYESLSSFFGKLRSEMGLEFGREQIAKLISHWVDTVQVQSFKFRSIGNKIFGGFKIQAFQADFQDIIQQEGAFYTSINMKGEATSIPWLKWLLLLGDNVIVRTHFYVEGPQYIKYSRTRRGIMMPKFKGHKIGWRVPPEFSGTGRNNWVTRGVKAVLPDVQKAFEMLLKGRL